MHIAFEYMVAEMVRKDMKSALRDAVVTKAGFKTLAFEE
jgi:hypothetical protein